MMDFTSPAAVGLYNVIGLGILGILTAAGQWYGRRKEGVAISKDVVVPSLTIADNAVIADATKTLREANSITRDNTEYQQEVLFELRALNRHAEEAKHALYAIRDQGRVNAARNSH